jgi:hypothetical protein
MNAFRGRSIDMNFNNVKEILFLKGKTTLSSIGGSTMEEFCSFLFHKFLTE